MTLPMGAGLGGGAPKDPTTLDVDTEKLREKGSFFIDNAPLIADKITTIGSTVASGVGQAWTDASGEDFTSKFVVFNKCFEDVGQGVVKLGQHMVNFADKYEKPLEIAVSKIEE